MKSSEFRVSKSLGQAQKDVFSPDGSDILYLFDRKDKDTADSG
ncbi:hypothetical protein [Kaistella faecalis]|nr:hypothetical protein [Chryseobacterium faecale]